MARLNPSPIRMYRGTTAQHSQYAGPIGELTVDTDKNTVVVQNGTDGGVPLAQERRQVIAGDGITVNGGASGTLASDITLAVDQTWIAQHAPAGPQGEPGPAGADGAPGAAATIAVGSVTTGAAGTQASVTNSGTANAAVLNFTIPQGAKGDKGDAGATGPAGEYTAGDGISISGDSVAVNQTWLDNYIDGLVNGGNLVTAGDGVDVTASGGVAEISVDDTVVRTSGTQTISGLKNFGSYINTNTSISLNSFSIGQGSSYSGAEGIFNAARLYRPADEELPTVGSVPFVGLYVGKALPGVGEDTPQEPCVAVNNVSSYEYPAEVVNVAFLKDYIARANSGVVHTTGNETVAGRKTFTTAPYITAKTPRTIGQFDGLVKGTLPEASLNGGFHLFDETGIANTDAIGEFMVVVESNGDVRSHFSARKFEDGSTDVAQVSACYPATGDPYATAPNTRSTPAANEIITFDFLENYVAQNAGGSGFYLPLYFQTDTTKEINTFIPSGVSTVRLARIQADGAGTSNLELTLTRTFSDAFNMKIDSSAKNCSVYASDTATFTLSGISDQTEVGALLIFE